MYFEYGEKEIEYLSKKDKKLGIAISNINARIKEETGENFIKREVDTNLFSSVVNNIIGQQISMSAQATICGRLLEKIGEVSAENICKLELDELKSIGISFRKAEYIMDFSNKVKSEEFALEKLYEMNDDEVIKSLSSLKGVGVWTAEMLMIFSMQRGNILSFGDLAIIRGMKMLYHHKEIDKIRFEKYRKRFSPYGTVASLYFWEISSGKYEGF